MHAFKFLVKLIWYNKVVQIVRSDLVAGMLTSLTLTAFNLIAVTEICHYLKVTSEIA